MEKDVTDQKIDISVGRQTGLVTDELFERTYMELRGIAGRYLREEKPEHTLQPTALVNEAYLRLAKSGGKGWASKAQFFSAAAQAIRRILVDHARLKQRMKRGGRLNRLSLESCEPGTPAPDLDLLALDDALGRLAQMDAQKAQLVELRFFAGLGIEQVADVLGVSVSTVTRDWRFVRAWLCAEVGERG